MRAVIGFTILAALCVWGAWWVAALPGSMSVSIAGTTIETSTPVGLTLLALLFLAIYLVIRLVATIWRSPRVMRRWRRDTNRRKGDLAVNRALVALAANDAGAARREAERSRRLLGDTPLTLLLAAQAGRQAGREDDAAAIFQQLAGRADGKLLGIRGLMRQAVARQDWVAASKLAEQAEAAHPGAAWLTEERRRMALQTGQYREALRLMGPSRRGSADPDARAALGIAAAEEETDANASLRLAKQAFEAEPSLGPAAIAYATRLRTGGRERSGLDVLRRCWSLLPQPGVAEAYMEGVVDPISRHSAAGGLVASKPAASGFGLAAGAYGDGGRADGRGTAAFGDGAQRRIGRPPAVCDAGRSGGAGWGCGGVAGGAAGHSGGGGGTRLAVFALRDDPCGVACGVRCLRDAGADQVDGGGGGDGPGGAGVGSGGDRGLG